MNNDINNIYQSLSKGTILFSYLIALIIDIVALGSEDFYWLPPITLLTLMYCSNYDFKYSFIFSGFVLGLMHDVLHQNLLGVHSLIFTIIIFIILRYRLRFRIFTQLQQVLFFILLLYLYQFILLIFKPVLLINSLEFWLSPLSTFIILPVIVLMFKLIRKPLKT